MDRQLCYAVVSYGNNFVISLGILANFLNIFESLYCVWDTLRLSYRSSTEENYGVKFEILVQITYQIIQIYFTNK
jgi:hypothetical protein